MNDDITDGAGLKLELDVTLPIHPMVAAVVRRCLEGIASFLVSEQFDNLRLLVNELVTNSIRHTGALLGDGWIRLRVMALSDLVRVEVCDSGPGFVPHPASAPLESPSGRGLYLVDQLADRWGVTGSQDSCVWFELDAA
jgi:anti-sigma regulatory factor (Ser/Thr protein kinase)